MLELRPSCEHCDRPLPPESVDARICSFECTFCADCARDVLDGVCPNCGGGFCQRPVRPVREWRPGEFLGAHPPTEKRRHRPVSAAEHSVFSATLRDIPPHER
jgi:uncharacterized protein